MTRLLPAIALSACFALVSSVAAAQIKEPGQHPQYMVELDPHLLVQYGDRSTGNQGLGFGLRASIPFVQNGPVPSINNNIGISFGADVAFFGGDEICRRRGVQFFAQDCSAWNLWLPATAQWNFFLTPVVSVFGELGIALQHERWSFEGTCQGGARCSASEANTDVEPTAFAGGRFLVINRTAGLTVRIGWPYLSVGGTMLF
jgi:hypothetical protein